jgi:hypothetical protein
MPGLLAQRGLWGRTMYGSEARRESSDVCFRKSYPPECQELLSYQVKVAGIFPGISYEEI